MTSNAREGSRILGSLRAEDGKGVVRMEDRYATDIDDLWSAITDPARLARWYGKVEGHLKPGGEFDVAVTGAWEGTGHVDACEPPRRLLVTMRDGDPQPGQPEETVMEVWLTADDDETILVAEDRGLPLPLLAAYGAGIQIHFENIAAVIADRELADTPKRWEELLPAYEALAADVRS